MRRRDISKALFATAAGSAVVAQRTEAQSCTAPCYPQTAAEIAAINPATGSPPVVPTNYTYAPGDIRRYGALTSASDNTISIQAALNQCLNSGARVYVPAGVWKYGNPSGIPTGLSVGSVAANAATIYGDAELLSVLCKTVDVLGLTVSGGAHLTAFNVAFDSSSASGNHDGIQINTTGFVYLNGVRVTNHGGNGIEVIEADIYNFSAITTAFNGGDGIRLTGSGSIRANAGSLLNINSINNTGWGLNVLVANANFGTGIVLQQNTAGGINLDTCFGNNLGIYCESNTGPDINFTSNCVAPNYGGNLLFVVFSDDAPTFNGASGNINTVQRNKAAAAYQPGWTRLIPDAIFFSNNRVDGATPDAVFTIQHTANLELDIISDGFSADKITRFSDNQGFSHIVQADVLAVDKAATGLGAGTLVLGSSTATTAAAGANGAVPSQVAGYLIFNLANATIKIPYFNS